MIQSKKIFAILAGVASLSLGVAVVFSVGKENVDYLNSGASSSPTAGFITFDGDNYLKDGTTVTTTGSTSTGANIVCKVTNNDSSVANGYVGALKNGSEIRFYEDDGITEYTFEDIEKIYFYVNDSTEFSNFKFFMEWTFVDGTTGNGNYTTSGKTNPRTLQFNTLGNISSLYIKCTNSNNLVSKLNSLKLDYNCTPKELTGIEIDSMPNKLTYVAGETFDPNGMVAMAKYSGGLKAATNGYSFSPNRPLTMDDTSIAISYHGFTTSIDIAVVEELPSIQNLVKNKTWTVTNSTTSYYTCSEIIFNVSGTGGTYKNYNDSNKGIIYHQQSFSCDYSTNSISFSSLNTTVSGGATCKRLTTSSSLIVCYRGDVVVELKIFLYDSSSKAYPYSYKNF